MKETDAVLNIAAGDYKAHIATIAKYETYVEAIKPYLAKDDQGRDLLQQVKDLQTENDSLKKQNEALLTQLARQGGDKK